MKRLLATSLLFISFLTHAQEPWGCTHHDYKEGQKVYSWKFNGIKMRSTPVVSSPTMKINPEINSIFDFTFDDFELLNYNPHPHIKGAVAI